MKQKFFRFCAILCALCLSVGCAFAEPEVIVPDEYTQTGTLPVYYAVERDFVAVVAPEWLNTSGIVDQTEWKGKNDYISVSVTFNDEAQLTWDDVSISYNMYSGTIEIPHERADTGEQYFETHPKPTMANAARTLASWMTFGWPQTGEVYTLEHQTLTRISLGEAKQMAEALFARLGLDGYVCETAIDMSVARIQEMGAKWNALIEDGHILNNPVLDYSKATVADEGYLLRYYRFGNDSDISGMFRADVYVTANGIAYLNICDMYACGDVCSTPSKLVDWHTVVDALPAELAAARYPMTLDEIVSIRLTWAPVRADTSKDGMVFTPVWVINFNASGDEQGGDGLHAIFDAIDGHLIDGNWI